MKIGLLLEAAQGQQAAAATALAQLREHTSGLDAIVREEIRHTLIEELAALTEESRRALYSLRRLQRLAGVRAAAYSAALGVLSALLPLAAAWWLLPSRGEITTLRAAHEQLTDSIARLTAQGAQAQLQHCGTSRRLCVRVDRSAPPYGAAGDYFVVKGY
jgi:hypothetical protein